MSSGIAGGTAQLSCAQGVTVVRQSSARLPGIDPVTAAALDLERRRLDLQRERLRLQAAQLDRRLDQADERLRLQSYLYRDANSPLRQRTRPRGFGTRGYGTGPNGVIVLGGR